MPVVTRTASHGPSAWTLEKSPVGYDLELLERSCPQEFQNCEYTVQSSFHQLDSTPAIYASSNGFVRAAISAYNHHHHHHRVVHPEDVWFSILTQLNLFINRN